MGIDNLGATQERFISVMLTEMLETFEMRKFLLKFHKNLFDDFVNCTYENNRHTQKEYYSVSAEAIKNFRA